MNSFAILIVTQRATEFPQRATEELFFPLISQINADVK
jgi:hypothetical protein